MKKDMTKFFELRDAATFIPVLCVCIQLEDLKEEERYLAGRAGFGKGRPFIYMFELTSDRGFWDPERWGTERTKYVSHKYICEKWDELKSGDVIDVEYILGIRNEPKISERLTDPFTTPHVFTLEELTELTEEEKNSKSPFEEESQEKL
jgi:hypothetical protein